MPKAAPGSGLQVRPRALLTSPPHQSLPALARRIMGEVGLSAADRDIELI
jgi:hypothetical protein